MTMTETCLPQPLRKRSLKRRKRYLLIFERSWQPQVTICYSRWASVNPFYARTLNPPNLSNITNWPKIQKYQTIQKKCISFPSVSAAKSINRPMCVFLSVSSLLDKPVSIQVQHLVLGLPLTISWMNCQNDFLRFRWEFMWYQVFPPAHLLVNAHCIAEPFDVQTQKLAWKFTLEISWVRFIVRVIYTGHYNIPSYINICLISGGGEGCHSDGFDHGQTTSVY